MLDVKCTSERLLLNRLWAGLCRTRYLCLLCRLEGQRKRIRNFCLGEVLSVIDAGERLIICGKLNENVGAKIEDFKGVPSGFGKWNPENEKI